MTHMSLCSGLMLENFLTSGYVIMIGYQAGDSAKMIIGNVHIGAKAS
jgi:hypothetical protein